MNLQPNPQQPFNLALKQPLSRTATPSVAEFDGKNLALLVDEPGEHPVALEWSARGEARPEGLYFDLRGFPPALSRLWSWMCPRTGW